jgi:hypothetical protein
MPHFTKIIGTEYGSMNFYFNRIFIAEGIRYHVSAIGTNGRAIIFHLEKIGNNWCLVKTEDVPHWLLAIEQKLSNAISEHIYGG